LLHVLALSAGASTNLPFTTSDFLEKINLMAGVTGQGEAHLTPHLPVHVYPGFRVFPICDFHFLT
jgi:hypothetical protein